MNQQDNTIGLPTQRKKLSLSNKNAKPQQKKHSGHDNALFILKQTNKFAKFELMNGKTLVAKIVNFDNFTITVRPHELNPHEPTSKYGGEDTCFYKHAIQSFRPISDEMADRHINKLNKSGD